MAAIVRNDNSRALIFIVSILVLPGILTAESNERVRTIYVGVASNFSGMVVNSYNPFGNGVRNGVQLALEKLNANSPKKKVRIETREFDYGGDLLKVRKIAEESIASDVVAVVGYEFSDEALIAAPLYHASKLTMFTPSASADRLGTLGAFVHQGTFENSFQGDALARFSVNKLHAIRAALIVAVDCAYCTDLAHAFTKKYEAIGGRIVKKIEILSEDKALRALNDLDPSSIDVIVIPNHELTSARVIASLLKRGITKPYLGGDGWRNLGKDFFKDNIGQKFTGYMVAHWHPDLSTSKSKHFVSEYKSHFRAMPTDSAALAYDTTILMGNVLQQLNGYDRLKVEKALEKVKSFEGVTGHFIYDSPNKAPRKTILIMKSVGSGFVVDHVLEP